MNFKDFNISMLDYDYDTAYAFLSVASRLSDLPDSESFTTNHVKFDVYARTFPVTGRDKYTGFEFVSDLDVIARQKISDSDILIKKYDGMSEIQRQTASNTQTDDHLIKVNLKKFEHSHDIKNLDDAVDVYRQHLTNNALKHQGQPNVLYFSGGADSEMVVWSFMEAGVDFVPVTFVYTDNSGNVLNYHDTAWADEFCATHNLSQVKREINVEEFWQSAELLEYAKKAQSDSPQIATYYKMVDLIHEEIYICGFEEFAGRQYTELGKISIPEFPQATTQDFTEVAPDIWSLKLFTPAQCDAILDVINKESFTTQSGDHIPVEELILPEYDQVFYKALTRYLENIVESFYFDTYHNYYFRVLTAWFDRLGADATSNDIESNQIRLHHNKSRISMSLVLNSEFQGGEINFPRQNFTNKHIPRGTLLMWPGQVTHPHCVMPITSGTRYSMNIYTKLETFSTRKRQLG